MKASVVVPNYNHASFLEQRLDSVLGQSFQDFEVIILDDCSTDGSRDIIERYRNHPRVSAVAYNEQNSGSPFRQWQKGIGLATGDWIWIAESDDYAHKNLLQELVALAEGHENVVLSYCQSVEVDEQNRENETMLWWVKDLDPLRWTKDYTNKGSNEAATYLLYKNTIPNASAVLFKRESLEAVNDQYSKMKTCGDWMFWVQLLQTGNVAYTATPLNFFRQHPATTRTIYAGKKLRHRLEEEYLIFQYIAQHAAGVKRQQISSRRKQLIRLYRESYTRKQMINFACFPFFYHGKLPLRWLVADYGKSILEKLFRRQPGRRTFAKA